jgi:hypothetical protein
MLRAKRNTACHGRLDLVRQLHVFKAISPHKLLSMPVRTRARGLRTWGSSFGEVEEAIQMPLGLPSGISPRPGCGRSRLRVPFLCIGAPAGQGSKAEQGRTAKDAEKNRTGTAFRGARRPSSPCGCPEGPLKRVGLLKDFFLV